MRYNYLFILFIYVSLAFGKNINLTERGIVGDGKTDNWFLIQSAIDEVINSGGGEVYFPKGEFAIYNKSIVIWGSNVTLVGESAEESIIVKKGNAGYFGDCLNIVGRINNYSYYGLFGKEDYNKRNLYLGDNIPSENIVIKNLCITTSLLNNIEKANNIGILNSRKVIFEKCIISNAPQSNVAIVNDTEVTNNDNIKFIECIFLDSGQHNVRVSSFNKGKIIGNRVEFIKCSFLNVKSPDIYQKEVLGYKLHLWYRGIGNLQENQLKLIECLFDDTGFIYCNGINNNISIVRSEIESYLFIQNQLGNQKSTIDIKESKILKLGGFKSMMSAMMTVNTQKKLKCGFVEETFGIQYPCNN